MKAEDIERMRTSFDEYVKRVQVVDKDGNLHPFKLNRVQRLLWNLFLEQAKAGKLIRWRVVK